ncbi:MAG: branched-chain amino acid transport system II carrier protein [bacterium]
MQKKTNDVIVVGVALFAMFFGAGNLIFPPYMGLLAGTAWPLAMIGFLITGIGMPLLGIMAAARAGGSVEHLGSRVNPWFGRVLGIVVILAIGPLLAIPRTAAVAFEMGIRPSFEGFSPALFSIIFFGITLAMAMKRSAVVDRIGKFLTPFLAVTLAWIIIKGILTPVGSIVETGLAAPFGRGFQEGYQTMDAMASIVFAEIVIAALIFKGYRGVKDQVKMTSLAGVIAAAGLGLVYGGLMYLGATAGSEFTQDVERTELLISIAQHLLGAGGKVALGLAVGLACLTTSIGLTATVADYFNELSKDRVSYGAICVATVVFSGVFATVGVETIVAVAFPLLFLAYPVVITLILLTMLGGPARHTAIYAGGVVGALTTSIFDAFNAAGLPITSANELLANVPGAGGGFGWILPALIGIVIGLVLARKGYGNPIPKVTAEELAEATTELE